MKKRILIGLIGALSFLLFNIAKAQVPIVDFAVSPTIACVGSSVQITDLSTNSPTDWSYTLQGSPETSSLQNPLVVYNTAGIYSITLIATNGDGQGVAVTKTIEIVALPELTIAGNTSICVGEMATLIATGADTYTWSTATTVDTETFSPLANTVYSISGTNTLTGCSTTNTLMVTVNSLPVLSISGNGSVCIGSNVTTTLSGAETYTWNGVAVSGNTLTLNLSANETFTLEGTNASGCTSSVEISLVANILPTLIISGPSSVCAGSSLVQTASGADSYLWDNGSTSAATTFTPASSTVYSVTGTDAITGCSGTETVSVTVVDLPALSLSGTDVYCFGGSATQSVSGADTYLWSTGSTNDNETFNPSITTVYSVTGTNTLTGCAITNTFEITVNPLPALSVTGSTALCLGSTITNTLNGADTYTWNGIAVIDNTITLTPIATENYTLEGSNGNTGCTNSLVISIVVNSLPTVSIAGDATVCAGSSLIQTASGADTYLWDNGSTAAATTFTPASSTVYSVTGTDAITGCSGTETVSVTTINLPVLSLTGTDTYCFGGSATQTVSGADTYLWSTGSTNDNETFNPSTSTVYSVTGTNTLTGCAITNTFEITVNPLPALSVTGSTALCLGSTITNTLNGADTYTWNGVAALDNTITLTPIATENYTLEGINSNSGCTNSVVISIVVNTLPTVTIAGDATVCAGSSLIQTASGADTYLWNSGSTLAATSFTPASSTVYSVTGTDAVTGCTDMETVSITVIDLPVLSLTGSDSYCFGGSATQTVSGADTYLWSTGTTNDNETTLTPIATENYTLEGSNSNTGCTNSLVISIVVNSLPTVAIAGDATVCAGSSLIQTASGADTYLWDNGSTAAATSFTPVSSTVYSVTGSIAATGCTDSETVSVAVIDVPVLSLIGTDTYCFGGSATQTVSGADSYLWSTGTTNDNEIFNPSTTTAYSVTGTNTLTGCATTNTLEITVNPLPVLAVSGNGSLCIGSVITPTLSGADSYTWSGVAVIGNTVSVNILSNTNYTLEGTIALTGCTNSMEVTIAVNPVPTVAIVGNATVCAGSPITLNASGTDTYEWNDGTVGASASFTPAASMVYTVTGTDVITGCTDLETASVTVIDIPVLTLSGTDTYCFGGSATQTVSGTDTYLWSTGTTNDNELFNPSVTTVYSVTGTSTLTGCSATSSVEITVNPLPVLSISGNGSVCIGSTITTTLSSADSYTWNGTAVSGNTVSLSPTVNTSYTLEGTSVFGCYNTTMITVAVNALPVISISGNATVCAGSPVIQTASGADNYLWDDGTTTGAATFSPLVNTDYTVTGTNTLTGCSNVATASVNAIVLPVLSLSGVNAYCGSGIATQTVSGADTYSWSTGTAVDTETFSPSTTSTYSVTGTNTLTGCLSTIPVVITVHTIPTITVNSGAICAGTNFTMTPGGASTYTYSSGNAIVTPLTSGDYTVTGTSAQGCAASNSAIASVTVNTLPVVSISNATICAGTEFIIQPTGGSTFVIEGNTATVTPVVTTSYTITSISMDGCASANTATLELTVNALPALALTGNSIICEGQTATLSVSGASTYVWDDSSTSTSITVNPTNNTSYSVTGTDINGCENSAVLEVTVNIVPTVAVTGGTICQGGSFTLTPNGANTYTYSGGNNVVSPNSTTIYTVTGSSTDGCVSQITTATVNVVTALTVAVSGDQSVCAGLGTTLTASGATSYNWSNGSNNSVIMPTPATNTTYVVTGTTGPCVNSLTVTVNVNPLPVYTAVSSSPAICVGQSVDLTVTGPGTYTWSTLQNSGMITVTPGATTTYTVGGMDANGCLGATSITQTVDACTGIENLTTNMLMVNLYPNPNNGSFNVEVEQEVSMTVMNNLGQVVYSSTLTKGTNQLNLDNQVAGLYFVTLQLGSESKTIKMIKN